MNWFRSIRRGLVVLGVVPLILSACLVPTGTATRMPVAFEGADPAAIAVWFGVAEVFTTNSWVNWGVWHHVPSYTYGVSNNSVSNLHGALPTLPTWAVANPAGPGNKPYVWAPTVRYVNGRYLMLVGMSRANGSLCIGAATSTSPTGTFTPFNDVQWCDSNGGIGWLDPQIFVDPTGGALRVYWSQQWAGGSRIVTQQMTVSSAGRPTRTGSIQTLVNFADVASIGGSAVGVVENPAVVADPYNGFDLLVSVGDWTNNSYRTVEVPCLAANGSCIPSRGGAISLGGNSQGGLSLSGDDARTGAPWMVFHARTASTGTRYPWGMSATTINLNNTSARSTSGSDTSARTQPTAEELAAALPIATAGPVKIDPSAPVVPARIAIRPARKS